MRRLASWLMVAAISAAPAYVLAGDCGGDVLCACGDRLVSDHTLSLDDPIVQAPCPGTGLTIETGGISLNGDKQTIVGSGVGAGIHLNGVSGVTVQRLIIEGFLDGIDTSNGVHASTFIRLKSRGNAGNGIKINGNGNDISLNKTDANGLDGINIKKNANNVEKNKAKDNGGTGVYVKGTNNVVKKNVAARNGGDGILVEDGGNFGKGNKGKKNTGNNCTIDGVPC